MPSQRCLMFAPLLIMSLSQPAAAQEQAGQARPAALDRYGDPLPDGALARLGTVRLRHRQHVMSVAYSHDGAVLASAGWDEVIRLWDSATGKPMRELGDAHRNGTLAIAFAPDSKALAALTEVGTVRLWDTVTGKKRFEKLAHKGRVYGSVAFAPDGRSFASGGKDVCIWDAATGAELRRILVEGGPSAEFHAVAFSANGKLLASGCGQSIRIWNLSAESGPVVIDKAHGRGVTSLTFTKDGRLVSGGYRYVDASKEVGRPAVRGVGEVRIWDAATGKLLRDLGDGAPAEGGSAIAVTRNGKLLASAHRERIRLWDLSNGKPVRELAYQHHSMHHPLALAFSPDGMRLVAAADDNTVRVWEAETGKQLLAFAEAHTDVVATLACSPDGKMIVTGSLDGDVRVWDAAKAQLVRRHALATGRASITAVAVTPDGSTIIAGGDERVRIDYVGALKMWDSVKGAEKLSRRPDRLVSALALAPDGKAMAVALWRPDHLRPLLPQDSVIEISNEAAGKAHTVLAGHAGKVLCLAFLPGGTSLAAVSGDRSVRVWDLATKRERSRFDFASRGLVMSAALSPDGGAVAIVVGGQLLDDTLLVRQLATGQSLHTFNLTGGRWGVMAFSPDGRVLAAAQAPLVNISGNYDYAMHLWEMATGRLIGKLRPGNTTGMRALAFMPDGRRIVSGMGDGTALTWPMPPADPGPALALTDKRWADLASDDAALAYRSMAALADAPERSVPYLAARVAPRPAIKPAVLQRLVAELDSDDFAVRDAAYKELERLEDQAAAAMRRALAGKPALETRRRLEELLAAQRIIRSTELLRRVRVIQVLEWIGSVPSRQLLQTLADGDPDARDTREAEASLKRLATRTPPRS